MKNTNTPTHCLQLRESHRKRFLPYLYAILIVVGLTTSKMGFANEAGLPAELKHLVLTEQYQQLEPQLRKLAIKGNAEGQYQLGMLYLQGYGVTANERMALYWFEKSAKQLHTKAQFNSAMLLMTEKSNRHKALKYLELAAIAGHKMAEKHLSNMTSGSDSKKGLGQSALNQGLIYSLNKDESDELGEWLKAGASANSADNSGRTALILAVESKRMENVAILLDSGADPRLTDSAGNTPIHFAVTTHNGKMVQPLSKQSDLEQKNKQGQTALLMAIELNDSNLVGELLSVGSNSNAITSDGLTALYFARRKSNKAIVGLLKQYGAKSVDTAQKELNIRLSGIREQLNQQQFEGWDEVMLAASMGDSELVGWLLSQSLTNKGSYMIGKAISQSIIAASNETTIILLDHSNKNSISNADAQEIFDLAVKYGDLSLFSRLYEHSLLKEAKNKSDGNLLRSAINEEKTDIAIYLIQEGGKYDNDAIGGETYLIAASKRGQESIVIELLGSGVAIDQQDSFGRTALLHSCSAGIEPVVALLLSKGAGIDIADQEGRTALMMAVQSNNVSLVKLLLRSGAGLDRESKSGNTPLHLAVEKTSPQIVSLLIAENAPISRRNNNSLTPLMLAVQADNAPVVKPLLKAGADPDRKNRNGRTAVDMANNNEMVIMLEKH